MSAHMSTWLAAAWATDTPVLPSSYAIQVWLHVGWSIVLGWLGASLSCRLMNGRMVQLQWLMSLVMAAWALVPGSMGVSYWLGLAFQSPSVSSVVVCALLLIARWRARDVALTGRNHFLAGSASQHSTIWLATLGVVLGWALLLDSFAVLPLQLYAWGFSPAAGFVIVLFAFLPWMMHKASKETPHLHGTLVIPLALLVFVVWRLPSGNALDAVLDPWLWFSLQVWLFRKGWTHFGKRTCMRLFGNRESLSAG